MNTAEEQRVECNEYSGGIENGMKGVQLRNREWNAMNTAEEQRMECNEYSGGTENGMQ